jgi:hypothetical protein
MKKIKLSKKLEKPWIVLNINSLTLKRNDLEMSKKEDELKTLDRI